MTKAKIEAVLKRLDRLGLGETNEDATGAQAGDNESRRRKTLSELVIPIEHGDPYLNPS